MWKRVLAIAMTLPVLAAAQAPSDWDAVRYLTSGTPLKVTLQGRNKPVGGTCRLINATESDLLCSMMGPYHEWPYPLKRTEIRQINLAIPKPRHHLGLIIGSVLAGLLLILGFTVGSKSSGGAGIALIILPILGVTAATARLPFPQAERNPDYKAGLKIYQAP